MPQIQTQIDKNTRKFIFLKIENFRKTWWIRMLNTIKKLIRVNTKQKVNTNKLVVVEASLKR